MIIACGSTSEILELIGGTLEQFESVLPRFQEYLKEFGSRELSGRLQETLITYYAGLIALYQDSIKFLRVKSASESSSGDY